MIHWEKVSEPKVWNSFLVVGDSGVVSSTHADRGITESPTNTLGVLEMLLVPYTTPPQRDL